MSTTGVRIKRVEFSENVSAFQRTKKTVIDSKLSFKVGVCKSGSGLDCTWRLGRAYLFIFNSINQTQEGLEDWKSKCFCKSYTFVTGKDYEHHAVNPSNQCQWCDLYDPTARANSVWSNKNLPCSDHNTRTNDDRCRNGFCIGTPYNCLPCERHDGSGCPIKSGYCIIQKGKQRTCYAKNQYKPGNPCQVGCKISEWGWLS